MFVGDSLVPDHFGDPSAEYRAAVNSAALFDLSDRATVELRGRDRLAFLHNFCTNDVKTLRPGEGCEAFLTNIKGRILGHVLVFAEEESLWLDSVPGSGPAVAAHLDKYLISEDVQVAERTTDVGTLYVAGPEAAARIGPLLDAGIEDLPVYGSRRVTCGGLSVSVRRVEFTLQPGYALVAPRGALPELWETLAGAGIALAGMAVFEALRIEAGFPRYGVDLTDDNIAQEAGRTAQAISFTKGCYLGQEPIARLDAMGHVNRELRGVRLADGPVSPPQSAVFDEGGGQEVGTITSSALSYADGKPVALALLRTQAARPGTSVRVRTEGAEQTGIVFWPRT